MLLAFLVSLPLALLTSSEVLSCVHRADMSRYITWYVGEMPWNANLFQWEFWASWNRMSWKQSAGHRYREAARCMRERQNGNQIECCTLASKKWGALEALLQMTYWSSFCLLQSIWHYRRGGLSIASQPSIGLVDIKWGTFMRPRSRYEQICHLICRRNAMKCQFVPVRIPSLLEQNVLKAVCRTQIQGSWKVYAGKTNWKSNWKLYPCKQEVRSTWSTLTDDLLEQLLFVAKHVTL